MDDSSYSIMATIIDLGLARIDQGKVGSFWTPFDEEIFEGGGDYQYDVYRMMRESNSDDWESYHPLTNVMVSAFFALLLYACADCLGSGYTTLLIGYSATRNYVRQFALAGARLFQARKKRSELTNAYNTSMFSLETKSIT